MTLNTRKFKRFVASFATRMDRAIPKALNRSGEKTVAIILDRTKRGIGLEGAFKRYSNEYREVRSDAGRSSRPDLNFTGRMLSNMDVKKVSTTTVLVNFKRREEQKKAKYNSKTRPFVGVRPQEKKFILEAFARSLRKDL